MRYLHAYAFLISMIVPSASCSNRGPALSSNRMAETAEAPATKTPDATTRLMTGAAWADYCKRIKVAGLQILSGDFPGSEAERAAGFRHLAPTLAMGLQWEVDFADPDFPASYRHNDDVRKWGGPNVDNSYLPARIDGRKTYRLTGVSLEALHLLFSIEKQE